MHTRLSISVSYTRVLRVLLPLCALLLLAGPAQAATDGSYKDVFWVRECYDYGNNAPALAGSLSGLGFSVADACLDGHPQALQINAPDTPSSRSRAQWSATTPSPSVRITGAMTPAAPSIGGNPQADCALHSDGYTAEYFWGNGPTTYGDDPITVDCHGDYYGTRAATAIDRYIQPARYFGWRVTCAKAKGWCGNSHSTEILDLTGILLEAQETTGPTFNPRADTLWGQPGWVRGGWSADLQTSDPSGVCSAQESANGETLKRYTDLTPDTSQWSQCPGPPPGVRLDTADYPNGPAAISLSSSATNAAGASSSLSRSINVDNAPVSVRLSGPRDAPSTAGTEYVSAVAAAGPSGVAGIACSVDGRASTWSAGATRRVPIQGIGEHRVSCTAQNRAVDSAGRPAASATVSWSLRIREPSHLRLTFVHTGARCSRPAETANAAALRGHCRSRREVRQETIGFGQKAELDGSLRTYKGEPLRHQRVMIETCPADGSRQFKLVAMARTTKSGRFTAQLPPGPSREVKAVYAGSPVTESASSSTVKAVVPAKIRLEPLRSHVPWGGVLVIRGEVLGGYIPPEQILQIRSGVGRRLQVIGNPYIQTSGRFVVRLAATGSGGPIETDIQVATLRETNYPYARGLSRRLQVTIG